MASSKRITALQLFRQKKKIQTLESKLYEEKRKLSNMVQRTDFHEEIIQVDGDVYKICPQRHSWENRVNIECVASVAELSKVLA